MLDSPHVLITGAAGFIGTSVARVLVDAGVRVTGLDDLSAGRLDRLEGLMESQNGCGTTPATGGFRFLEADVRDRELLLRTLLHGPFGPTTSILHLAGRVGVRRVLRDPEACEVENLEGGRAIAAAVRHARGQGRQIRVVAASTSEVYAESSDPLSEASPLRPLAAEGRWRYAASKRAAEHVLDQAVEGAIHLRFFNVVGPDQDSASGMVLPRFIEAARRGEPLRIHGQGTQVRTLAHVEAVARDVAALTVPEAFTSTGMIPGRGTFSGGQALAQFRGPLNIGGNAQTTIRGLAEAVANVVAESNGEPAAALELVDPSVDVGDNFEDVRHRVPDLSVLYSLGLAGCRSGSSAWTLEDIVRDAVLRHVPGSSLGPSLDVMSCGSPVS